MTKCICIIFSLIVGCSGAQSPGKEKVVTGAEQLDLLLPKLQGKKVAFIVNATAIIGQTHLIDTLKRCGVDIVRIFGPEHGFRGDAADGEDVNDSIDLRTGIPVISLYTVNRLGKPTAKELSDVDVVVYDIQDVGARFYTYPSTLHYLMDACAENNKRLILLDRPNPNASYIDGPILQPDLKSFVGMHPIPIVHGLTLGELALMMNGEGWLERGRKCNVEVIKLKHWKHEDEYSLPVRPSPNLPNDRAIRLYPSLCLFEGTPISVGRGTPMPFQVLGNPELKNMKFQFTPISIKGVSVHPAQENKVCYGVDLRDVPVDRKLDLTYLLEFYQAYPQKEKFFTPFFDKLAGTHELQRQIKAGLSEAQIRATWQKDLEAYKLIRQKYLLYP